MTTAIPDLWPKDVKIDVLPPIAILKAQEGLLARKTQGMLVAKLSTAENEILVQHQLDLIAPALDFYRERLLSATHGRIMLYPVTVRANCFRPKPATEVETIVSCVTDPLHQPEPRREAATDEEFVQLVGQVLQSADVRALIYSLIARINQASEKPHGNGHIEPESTMETFTKGKAENREVHGE